MPAGDTVALCRGGSWTGSQFNVNNPRCAAANTCDFRDYGTGARPIINGGTATLFNFAAGANVFTSGVRFWNIDLRFSPGGIGFWMTGAAYGGATDVDICNLSQTGGDGSVVDQFDDARITIRNSQFYNTVKHAILAGSDDLVIDSNYFENCGATDSQVHTIYVQQKPYTNPNGAYMREHVTNNEIHVNACGGSVLIAHGRHNNAVIENNLIDASAASAYVSGTPTAGQYTSTCTGIEVDCQYPTSWGTCTNAGAAVRRNRVFLGGGAWGVRMSQCPNCTLTDNILVNARGGDGIVIGYDDYGTLASDNMTIQNNSVYVVQGGGWGMRVGEGTGHVITNNAFWYPTGVNGPWPYMQGGSATVNANNRSQTTSGSATSWWVSPGNTPAANFTLPPSSPLIGTGNSTYYSPTAIGTVTWSATDKGVTRGLPVEAGAY
jgi:hypothetical protein